MPASALYEAILAVQAEVPTLVKDSENSHFRNRYTSLDAIVKTVGPILHKHKLVWMTLPGTDTNGQPALLYRLAHVPTGEVLEGTMPLLLSKQDAQGHGSAITYARRYTLCAVLNLVADDDDDGNAAANGSKANRKPDDRATDNRIAWVKSLLKGKSASEIRGHLQAVGVADTGNVAAAVSVLSKAHASALIERVQAAPDPDPEHPSDVPSDVPWSPDYQPEATS